MKLYCIFVCMVTIAFGGVSGQRIISKPPTLKDRTCELEKRLKGLEKKVDELTRQLAQTNRQFKALNISGRQGIDALPQTAEASWRAAMMEVENQNLSVAEKKLNTFINTYSTDSKVSYAHYWLGELCFEQGKYYQAQGAYQYAYDYLPEIDTKKIEAGIKVARCLFQCKQLSGGCEQLHLILQGQKDKLSALESQMVQDLLSQYKCKN